MITKDEIQELLHSTETYRVERTTSTGDMDKFQEAICAFANDLPNSRKNGYLILGGEILLNACMHRDMQSNTPLRFYEFANHLEILNAGGLYGNARPENFPRINDYRNPLVASAMKTLGYVNMFSRGIGQVQTDLKENGNKPAQFDVSMLTAFLVTVEQKDIEQFKFVPSDGAPMVASGDDVTSLSQALSQVLSQVCPKLDVSHYPDATAILIALCKEPQSLKELMEKTKEKNRGRIKNNVLQHLCESGLVEPTIKDVPNSPKQKYTLTDNGREKLYEHLKV